MSIEQMNDAEFLRYLARIGGTIFCEEVMGRCDVADRLQNIAAKLEGKKAHE